MFGKLAEYILKTVVTIVIIVGSAFLLKETRLNFPLNISSTSVSSELSVVGEGKIDVVPDTAYVDVGVNVNSLPSADEVQKQLAEQNNKIVAAMRALGIESENIKTSNYSISPNYVYENGRSSQNGFIGNASITVKTDKVEMTGKIIEEATKAGATQVGSARFSVDKPELYREQARDKAIENAKTQAQKLASTLGISLGKITNVVESSINDSPIYYSEKALNGGGYGGGPVDLQAGTQTITSVVTLYFEKK